MKPTEKFFCCAWIVPECKNETCGNEVITLFYARIGTPKSFFQKPVKIS